jgi:hypothetical protein
VATGSHTASSTGPETDDTRDDARVLPVLLLPGAVSAVALLVSGSLGHLLIGVLVTVGVGLGVVNGLLMEHATAKITPDSDHEKQDVVKASLGRLAIVTGLALLIAFLARPDGWVLLVSLACYQILVLLSQLGAAAREARSA